MKTHDFAVGAGAQFQANAAVAKAACQLGVLAQTQAMANAVGVQVVGGLPDVFGAFAFTTRNIPDLAESYPHTFSSPAAFSPK